jgi:hypothetical protein
VRTAMPFRRCHGPRPSPCDLPSPDRQVSALEGQQVKQVSCGAGHTLFLTQDGAVYGCGDGASGQLTQRALQMDADAGLVLQPVKLALPFGIQVRRSEVHPWGGEEAIWTKQRQGADLDDVGSRFPPSGSCQLSVTRRPLPKPVFHVSP